MYKSVAGGEALISEIAAQEDQEGIVVAKRLDAPYRAADLAEDQEQGILAAGCRRVARPLGMHPSGASP